MKIHLMLTATADYLRYHFLLTTWNLRQKCRRLALWLRTFSDWFKRIVILAASLILARLILMFVDLSLLRAETLSGYFIAAGAMTGGILAIVFSISIFAQQSATDLSSSGYFEDYTRGWNEKLIYILIVVATLLFFAMGVLLNGRAVGNLLKQASIYLSLMLIGVIFILIDWQYQNVSRKLSPLKAITYLQSQALKFLKGTHKDAKRIATMVKAKQKDASDNIALGSAYNRYLQPHLDFLDRQIENLFEIAARLSARQEVMTTNRAFTAAFAILNEYLDIRKTSSFAFMSSVSFLAVESDSQSFLGKSFERFNSAGDRFIKEGRTENATHIVEIYKALAVKAGEIAFPQRYYENPIFDQVSGYLGFYIKFAEQQNSQDVVLSGSRAFANLAAVALKSGLQTSLLAVQKNLHEIAVFGITSKATFITDECVAGWQSILEGLFQHKFFGAEHQISEALEKMGQTTQLMHLAVTTGILPNDFITKTSLSKPYDEMNLLLSSILKVYFEGLTESEDKSFYRRHLIELLEQIYWNVRNLSEKIPLIEGTLTTSIGNLLFNLDAMMIQLLDESSFAEVDEDLRKQLYSFIHLPGYLFNQPDSLKVNRFESLTESAAKAGILCFQRKREDKLVLACVQSLYWMVKKGLEKSKEGYGYDEPRAMLKICYLGVLALKQKRRDILTEVGVSIYEFEERFREKYFTNLPPGIDPDKDNVIGLPRKDQLFWETYHWRDEFGREKHNQHRIMRDAQDMMYDLINENDIDRFMWEVWHSIPGDSPLEKEVKDVVARQVQVARLIRTLKTGNASGMQPATVKAVAPEKP
jgi:hypothetical protein